MKVIRHYATSLGNSPDFAQAEDMCAFPFDDTCNWQKNTNKENKNYWHIFKIGL